MTIYPARDSPPRPYLKQQGFQVLPYSLLWLRQKVVAMPLDVSTSVLATYGSHLGIWLVYKIGSFESEDTSKQSVT